MAIYQTAEYRVQPSSVETVKRAIEAFVDYVRANEQGTRMYAAWQRQDDPTRFVHLFIFEDEAAQKAHSESAAVAGFEEIYGPDWLVAMSCSRTSTSWPQTVARTGRSRSSRPPFRSRLTGSCKDPVHPYPG